eukprot:7652637-Pyramimonas_sp.AAC.1
MGWRWRPGTTGMCHPRPAAAPSGRQRQRLGLRPPPRRPSGTLPPPGAPSGVAESWPGLPGLPATRHVASPTTA